MNFALRAQTSDRLPLEAQAGQPPSCVKGAAALMRKIPVRSALVCRRVLPHRRLRATAPFHKHTTPFTKRCFLIHTVQFYCHRQCPNPHVQGIRGCNTEQRCCQLLKRWILKNAYLVFSRCPETVMDLAFECCVVELNTPVNLMAHSGYGSTELNELIITSSDEK